MSKNVTLITAPPATETSSTQGLTMKVVKGSFWTLMGQILPFIVSLVSTPFIIRFLGSEAYGILILAGLIPNYFAFADLGMGLASTKFGSEAYGQGNSQKEGEVVRTAAFIALLTSLVFMVPLFIFAPWIIEHWFKIPENYQSIAGVSLRITSMTFVLGALAAVFNTPLLARLRMDINTVANSFPKILLGIATPLVLYFGGFVVEAVWVGFFAALLIFLSTVYLSGRFLPELYKLTINRNLFRPLLTFGGGWVIAMIASIFLANLEKFFLTRYVSVQSLAHYSVAFTFANMATMFSVAMIQSLLPAFSRLLTPETRAQLNELFSRGVRFNIILLLPLTMFLFVIAKPFFTFWAGAEFGEESTLPFYILLFGLFFNIMAYISHCIITASGRTDIFAKIYWTELVLYVFAASALINAFGILGAALAWSLRVVVDTFFIVWLARRITGISFDFLKNLVSFILGFALLLPPVIFAVFYDNYSLWLFVLVPVCSVLYALLVWKCSIDNNEKAWIKDKIGNFVKIKI